MPDITSKIGQIVEARRKQLGLTQARLAKAAGVTQKTISAIENGKQDMNSGTMMKLSQVLDLSPSEMAGLDKRKLPDEVRAPSQDYEANEKWPRETQSTASLSSRFAVLGELIERLSTLDEDELRAFCGWARAFTSRDAVAAETAVKALTDLAKHFK